MIELIKKELNNNSYKEYLKDSLEKFYEKHKFKLLNTKTFIERSKFRMNIMLTQDISMKELIDIISKKYKVELNIEEFIEVGHCRTFLSYLLSKKDPELSNRFEHLSFIKELEQDILFLYRVFIRIVLYKNNWSPEMIEKIIINKFDMKYKYKSVCFLSLYFLLDNFVDKVSMGTLKKGRRKFPTDIKQIFDELSLIHKVKQMNIKYKIYNIVSKLDVKDYEDISKFIKKSDIKSREKIIKVLEELKTAIA